MSQTLTLASIIEAAQAAIDSCDAKLAKFEENFSTNPVYAFKWGEDALGAGVRKHELMRLIAACEMDLDKLQMTEEQRIQNLADHFRRETIRYAEATSRSTAAMANLIEDHERATAAKIFGYLSGEFLSSL